MKLHEVMRQQSNKVGGGINRMGQMRNVNRKLGAVGHTVKKVMGDGSRILYKMK